MSRLDVVRDAIITQLSGVPNIGKVHPYERFATNAKAFRELYVENDKLLGWYVRRIGTREISVGEGVNHIIVRWRITGLMAIDDVSQSELTFDNLIEDSRDQFRADRTLGGSVIDSRDLSQAGASEIGLQLEDSGPVTFCGVLCHSAKLGLVTTSLMQF